MTNETKFVDLWLKNNLPTTNTTYSPEYPPNSADPAFDQQPGWGVQDWDYKEANATDRLGMNGEELPQGAKDWDPFGRAYFGDGVGAYFQGMVSRLSAPREELRSFDTQRTLSEEADELFFSGDLVGGLKLGFQSLVELGTVAAQNLANIGDEDNLSIVGATGRVIEEIVRGVFSGLDAAVKGGKRILTTPLIAAQEIAEESVLPALVVPEFDREDPGIQQLISIGGNLISAAWDTVRATQVNLSGQAEWSDVTRAWQASRMGMTAVIEDATRAEYFSRLDSGINPTLLAMELENPWLEIAAELPIDIIGGKIWGKFSRLLRHRYDLKYADDVVGMTDEAAEIVRDVGRLDMTDEVVATGKGDKLRNYLIRKADETTRGLINDAEKTGLFKWGSRGPRSIMLSTGKRAIMEDRTFGVIVGVMGSTRNPDEALEIFKSIADMYSGSEKRIITDGMAALKHVDAELLLSNGAAELGVFLNQIEPQKWFDDFIKITDDTKRLDFVVTKMEGAIEGMYPTLTQRIITSDAAKAAGEVFEEIPQHYRIINRAHESAQRFFGPINAGLSEVLMRKNPGFNIRNFIQNRFQIAVDEGIRAAFTTGKRAEKDLLNMTGGVRPPGAFKTFGGPPAAAGSIKDVGFSARVERAAGTVAYTASYKYSSDVMQAVGVGNVKDMIGFGVSEESARLLSSLSKKHFGDVDKILADFIQASDSGAYDLIRVLDPLSAKDIQGLDNVMGRGAREEYLSITDEAIREGWTEPQIQEALEKRIFQPVRDEAAASAKQGAFMRLDDGGVEGTAFLDRAEELGDVSAVTAEMGYIQKVANSHAEDLMQKASYEMVRDAKAFANTQILDPALRAEALTHINQLEQKYSSFFSNRIEQTTAKEVSDLLQPVLLNSYPNGNSLAQKAAITRHRNRLVESLGGPEKAWTNFGMPGTPPKGLTRQQLYNSYWDQFTRPQIRNIWSHSREINKTAADSFIDELQRFLRGEVDEATAATMSPELIETLTVSAHVPPSNLWAGAVDAYDEAVKFDNMLQFSDGSMVFARGPRAAETRSLMILAQQYGIPGATDAGVFTDQILRTINKFSDQAFNSLDDIPLKEGRAALARWAVAKKKPVITKVLQDVFPGQVDEAVEAATEAAARQIPELPRELQRSAPRYNFGSKGFELTFESDVDRALYIVSSSKKSAADAKFMEYLQSVFPNKSITEIRESGRGIRSTIKELARTSDPGTLSISNSGLFDDAAVAARGTTTFDELFPPLNDSGVMQTKQQMARSNLPGYEELFERIKTNVRDAYSKKIPVNVDADELAAVRRWEEEARKRMLTQRTKADLIATRHRDFTLHDYRKMATLDKVGAYAMPWMFWHTRTYAKWIKRTVYSPGWIAAYGTLRDHMEKIHAGMPDWWKYNINTNDLGFTDWENPLFFNLEASINPLYGLTGTNFDDPHKRVNQWTAIMDDAGKFGPSMHPLWNIVAALFLKAEGEDEAAARWGGTGLIPQFRVIRAIDSLIGDDDPIQLDPFVWMFSGGIDPYEATRVGRAGYAFLEENPTLAAQMFDEFQKGEGELYDMAIERAVNDRAWSNLASFFMGVGLRPRTEQELEIERFDQEWRRVWGMRDEFSDTQFREVMFELDQKYPFGDFLLMTRKGGVERDAKFAYNVLGRLPPGGAFESTGLAGISGDLLSQFYEDKGDLGGWKTADRQRFMAGILDLAALLEMPDNATLGEWTEARDLYSQARKGVESLFGEEIWQLVDNYYGFMDDTQEGFDRANEFLEANPEAAQAQDYLGFLVMNDPLLTAYYGGIDTIERYEMGKMRAEAQIKFGSEIWDIQDEYWNIRTTQGNAVARGFLRQNPVLKQYWSFSDERRDQINRQLIAIGASLPEPIEAQFREDVGELGVGGAQLQAQLEPNLGITQQEWTELVGVDIMSAVRAWLFEGRQIDFQVEQSMKREARSLDMDVNEMIQLIGQSLQVQQTLPQ